MRLMRNQMEEGMNDRYVSTTQTVAMRHGHDNEIRIFKPKDVPSTGSPLVLLVHAGGFAVGVTRQMSPFAQRFSQSLGATVVNVTHGFAPNHVFPIAPQDIGDAVKWLIANARSLGADPQAGCILVGVSSGANLAAVTAQRAVKGGLSPPLTGVWICMPYVLTVPPKYAEIFISREQAANATLIDTQRLYPIVWRHHTFAAQ